MEVTRMWFDDELNFRHEVPKALLGGHIGRREDRPSEVARLLSSSFFLNINYFLF